MELIIPHNFLPFFITQYEYMKKGKRTWTQKFEKKYGVLITNREFIHQHLFDEKGIQQITCREHKSTVENLECLASVLLNGKARRSHRENWEKYRVLGKNNYDEIVKQFTPNLTPRQIFKRGSFGGTYWRPIYSSVTQSNHKNVHKKYPSSWWKGIHKKYLTTPFEKYDKSLNKYSVKVGTTLKFWESKLWINERHPYGWVQWYCDWCIGKRSPDDIRQIKRWLGVAGKKGRFRKRLMNMIYKKGGIEYIHDFSISPSIRQTLQHWGYIVSEKDYMDNF